MSNDVRKTTCPLSRRNFLKLGMATGIASIFAAGYFDSALSVKAGQMTDPKIQTPYAADPEPLISGRNQPLEAEIDLNTGTVTPNPDILMLNSSCLGCYSSCGNRVKLEKSTGKILNVTGNPYNPNNCEPNLSMEAPLTDAYLAFSTYNDKGHQGRASICARGNATLTAHYDPNRILVPLKRTGERGSGKWKPITWEEAIQETVKGGRLFEEAGENREVEGFRAVYDTETPMDPDQPELGPVSEQLVLFGGRGDGRGAMTGRFFKAFGSNNNYGHGYSCGGSYTPTNSVISDGQLMRPDVIESEFILFNGAYPGHSGKPMTAMSRQVAVRVSNGELKFAVVDPLMIGGAVSPVDDGSEWVPIKPATDPAFLMAMIGYIIDEERYNESYLSAPNLESSRSRGFNSFCNASSLVVIKDGKDNGLLDPEMIGLELHTDENGDPVAGSVVIDKQSGEAVLAASCNEADIYYDGTITDINGNDIQVKTSFLLVSESVHAMSLDEYSDICGVPAEKIIELAEEFTSHGTKVSLCGLGGSTTANGANMVMGQNILCCLTGCYNMPGGMIKRRIAYKAASDGARYSLSKVEGLPELKAQRISRTGVAYEKTAEFRIKTEAGENPYPSKLPWYAIGSGSDNQALFSIINSYPYAPKIVINWMANPFFAVPAAAREDILAEYKKAERIPLHITIDAFMGEMAAVSDYIIPDTTPYESWGMPNIEGNSADKGTGLRWPVIEPATMALGGNRYANYENYLIDVAKELGLPGFGDDAIKDIDDHTYPLNSVDDLFLRAVVNMAFDGEPVPDISDEELELQGLNDKRSRFAAEISDEEWRKAAYVISRGGRFAGYRSGMADGTYAFPHEGCFNMYAGKLAASINSYSGEAFTGTIQYLPQKCHDDSLLSDHYPENDWPFMAVSYKAKFRSISMLENSILADLCPHNYAEINTADAEALGLSDGDEVRIISATGGETAGIVLAREGVAPGTIGVAFGYGHWEYGTRSYHVDNTTVEGKPASEPNVNLVACSPVDPTMTDTLYGLSEQSTGMCVRNGGAYRIEKV